jgi:glutathione S-transferase
MPIQITYFPVKGRVLPILVARAGGLDFTFTTVAAENWPGDLKAKCPFGQLPIMVDGNLMLGQSLAIANYLAKKAKLLGDSDEDFGLSQSLMQEAADIQSDARDGMSNFREPAKKPGYEAFVAEKLPLHLGNLEKLVKGDKFTSSLTVGELALFLILNRLLDVLPGALDKFPKVKAFYQRVLALPRVKEFLEVDMKPQKQVYQKPPG